MLRRAAKRCSNTGKQAKRIKQNISSGDGAAILGEPGSSRKLKSEEEATLEQLVLGGRDDLIANFDNKAEKLSQKLKEDENLEVLRKAAWVDDEDETVKIQDVIANYKKGKRRKQYQFANNNINYKTHLASRFAEINGTPTWAKLDQKSQDDLSNDSSDDEDGSLLGRAGDLLSNKSEFLPKGTIHIRRCRDLNYSTGEENPRSLTNVEFHPSSSVALVAGTSGYVTLVQVDGKTNPKIQSVTFPKKKFPVSSAHFSSNGEELLVGSEKRRQFYYYDMMGGNYMKVPWRKETEYANMGKFQVSPDDRLIAFHGPFGYIHLLSAKTKEWISDLKMNSNVEAMSFNRDGSRLYSHGDGGDVYIWDTKTRDCIHRFVDDGCIKGTAVALSPNGNYIACGSDSGVVNIYNTDSVMSSSSPKPSKVLLNLTTPIKQVKFNATSEMMVMSSDRKDNAIKLVHFPSMTVFSNFPRMDANQKRTVCFDLSLNSGYFTLGNNCGTAYLYRLKHYGNY